MLVALGCAEPERTLVGTWNWEGMREGADVGYNFAADGTYHYWYQGAHSRTDERGSWSLDGKLLTLKPNDKSVPTNEGTIEWLTANQFEWKDSKGTTRWLRQKE